MQAVKRGRRATKSDAIDLERMVGPDKHRPGPARARLIAEQVPVWAIIGHIEALAETTEPAGITDDVIAQVAADYDIGLHAVQAALLYYQEHRCAIDALLEANAAALE